jgi:hypothetical protein
MRVSLGTVEGTVYGLLVEAGLANHGKKKYVKVEGKKHKFEQDTAEMLRKYSRLTVYLASSPC